MKNTVIVVNHRKFHIYHIQCVCPYMAFYTNWPQFNKWLNLQLHHQIKFRHITPSIVTYYGNFYC